MNKFELALLLGKAYKRTWYFTTVISTSKETNVGSKQQQKKIIITEAAYNIHEALKLFEDYT